MSSYIVNHLRELESEAIFVIREIAAQFENPALLFSGGKDSILLTHLAKKAFYPANIPFPLIHVDTGHNFPETIEFRDSLVEKLGVKLIVGSVQESIDKGRVKEETGSDASRNALQIVSLLDTLEEYKVDAAMGGARRDEEKARAKERFFHTVMSSDNGILKISVQNCGICSMVVKTMVNTLGFFRYQTGLKWMYGNTLNLKALSCPVFIFHISAIVYCVMV